MAIFLGTQGGDILAWRGIAEHVAEIREMIVARMTCQLTEENVGLLKALQERLEEEIAFEETFLAEFGWALGKLEQAAYQDEFTPLIPRFNQLTQDYFRKRGSVVAVHSLCNAYRDALLRRALQWTEDALELDEMRRPPAPYCWFVSGSAGREEQTFCVDPDYFLIYGEAEDDAPGYFDKFAYRIAALLGKIGLLPDNSGSPAMKTLWWGGRNEWRNEIVEKMPRERKGLANLLGRADLRLLHGDAALAEEMLNVVRSMLEFRHGELRETTTDAAMTSRTRAAISFPAPGLKGMGKSIAEIPTGLDFFGRLKVEKSGRQRGKFNLEQYALAPLIKNVRMLAIEYGLVETGTIARIKGLQSGGQLSVELTERLLRAYHEFTRLKLLRQIKGGCETEQVCYIKPEELSEDEDQRLRNDLEAVSDLERIAYLCFTEHG
jgi:CBS domain-containing protein